jgi:hypothetical protein
MPVTLQPVLSVTMLPVLITVDNGGVVGAVQSLSMRESPLLSGLMGSFKVGAGNSSAGFDGRSAPATPDASIMHSAH